MIYLDNAATTKPDSECLKRAEQYLTEKYFNPSAMYAEGYGLHKEIEKAKSNILNCVGGDRDYSLIFTSCGTEADNHAIFCGGKRGNVVTTLGEHSAVFSAVNELKSKGIEIRFADLQSDGSVNTDSLLNLVDENTALVSVIHVNNETGALNDINNIAKAVKAKNPRTLFHSDGVQAFGKIPYKLSPNVDLYSISAHKIGGAKGTGALIKRKNLAIKPFIYGGGQEDGLRSGTENVFGIKMLEFAAVQHYANIENNFKYVQKLRDVFCEELDGKLFSRIEGYSPYICCVLADGLRGEIIMHEVNDKGLIIGNGSACSSNSKKRYSRVLLACGISEDRADGALRISLSAENTLDEVKEAAKILNQTVAARRQIME